MEWLDEAAKVPVAFAQVREDPLLDLEAVEAAGAPARVMMVASGGCTAAFLAASGRVASLTLVDPNEAQLALTQKKLELIAAPPAERRRAMGHKPHDENGPDHLGRYERLFGALRARIGHRQALLGLAIKPNLPVQRELLLTASFSDGEANFRSAFTTVFAHRNLVRLFGESATANPARPFDEHFFDVTMRALGRWTIAENPWLAQLLIGRFGRVAYPWLDAPPPPAMPELAFVHAPMEEALAAAAPRSFDVVHLSNILDWLSPGSARETLALAAKALRPGGIVLVRQLNSTLDVCAAGEAFDWDRDWSVRLWNADRSFFYRAIHAGRAR